MTNVWDGKHQWIWELSSCENGNVQAIISKLKDAGFRGVIIKAHDGANVWSQFAACVNEFKAAGLIVGAWGYCYGDNPSGEAQAAHQAFINGADWYVADVEAQYEGKQSAAVTFGQLLRSWMPQAIIGYSSFPFGNLHQSFPYKEFSAFCNVALPQAYWNELAPTADVCIDQTMAWYQPLNLPVAPVGSAFVEPNGGYVPKDSDYDLFQNACNKYSITGNSWWSYQHTTPDMWVSLKRIGFPAPVVAPPVDSTPPVDNSVSDYAKDAVAKAIRAGLMQGDGSGSINPKGPLTREDFCVELDRAGILDEIIKVKGV